MRKPELAAAIAEQADLSKEKASEVITAITDQIAKALSEGDSVSLIGFGTFEVRDRKELQGKTHRLVSQSPLLRLKFLHSKPVRL